MAGEHRDRVRLVHALADLDGRSVSDVEAEAILTRAATLDREEANAIWAQLRRARRTVSLRNYLAITVRFLDLADTEGRDPP